MKRLAIVLFMILFMLLLTGCGEKADYQESNSQKASMFVVIQKSDLVTPYSIVYHRETKVMYAVSCGGYNTGTFTLLVNPDGTPMLYEAEREVKDDQ